VESAVSPTCSVTRTWPNPLKRLDGLTNVTSRVDMSKLCALDV
jgi:hypothetical protein